MRPTLAAWLTRHGLPPQLVPDYFVLVALASILGAAWLLRRAREQGVDVRGEAWTIALTYVAALGGGYVFEAIRAALVALATWSLEPFLHVGRAAWGGFLGGSAVALWHVRRRGRPVAPFFDSLAIVAGISFLLVRTGCFLAGCDYGRPTSLWTAVRFPPGSLAAVDHAERGWVPLGAPSLPVHPTQLYEAGVALIAMVAAWAVLRAKVWQGAAFLTWLGVYAVGRFAVEALRGDADRGIYLHLSTAQYVCLAALGFVGYLALRGQRAVVRQESGSAG